TVHELFLRKRRTRAQPQHRLLFGFFYVRGELVLVEFEINAAVGRAFDAAHLDLRVDEQKPLLIKQLDALFEFFDAGGGKTSLDAAALGNLHQVDAVRRSAGHPAWGFVGLVVENKNLEIARLAVRNIRQGYQIHEQVAVAVEGNDAPVRQGQRQSQCHRCALSEIHVVEVRARRSEREPLVHGVAQVGNDEIVIAYGSGQGFQTVEALHRRVSPLNKMQIGFCQANAELTASWIAPSIAPISLTGTYGICRSRRIGSVVNW